MSDTSQGPGWWQASDGKWYPPESAPAPSQPTGFSGGSTAHSGELADWGTRALGILIDFALLIALVIVGAIIAAIASAISDVLGLLVWILVWLVYALGFLYYGYIVGAKGQSPGMAMMGLRCIGEETGQVIGGGMGIVRSIAHILDNIICYIGWLFPLWDAKRQTLADKVVKTIVIVEPKKPFSIELYKL